MSSLSVDEIIKQLIDEINKVNEGEQQENFKEFNKKKMKFLKNFNKKKIKFLKNLTK